MDGADVVCLSSLASHSLFTGCKGCMPYAFFPNIGISLIFIDHRCSLNVTVRVIIVLDNTDTSHVHVTDDIYSILITRVLKIGSDWWNT